MNALYKTEHSITTQRIYQQMSDVFFTAIAFYLSDKRGWKARRICDALNYINRTIEDLNNNGTRWKDYKDTLYAETGIVIEKKPKGIHIYAEVENDV